MDRQELNAWLRLTLTPGVGNGTARRLLAAFGLPQAIFMQDSVALRQVVTSTQASALRQEPEGLAALLEATWQWLEGPPAEDARNGISRRLLSLGDASYPASLLATEDPPLLLYLMGQTWLLESAMPAATVHAGQPGSAPTGWPMQALAMVGSRNPTPQGRQNAHQFARAFSAAGFSIVSGMALGIDGAAHEGALAACHEEAPATRLATIAVIGTGIDRVYPRQHRELAHRIVRHGLIISEYPLGTPPLSANFPKRNRLIAGLAQGALVVEAALQSGSLITARLAGEQGKDVFAIPGSIHSPQARGCHALIRQGAKLVETAQDVLEELRYPSTPPGLLEPANAPKRSVSSPVSSPASSSPAVTAPSTGGAEESDELLSALGGDPVSLDVLQARTGLDTPTLQARLLTLELDGHIGRLPGGLFQRLAQG